MTRRSWTPAEDADLLAYLKKGQTAGVIARKIGRSESSVNSRTQVLAIKAKRGNVPAPVERPCMCCRKIFRSDGPHHRLCVSCRRIEKTPFDL